VSDRFTDRLRSDAEPTWSAATGHRFTDEVGAGSVPDAVFAEYLTQDYAFVDALASLVGYAVAQAPRYEAKQRLGGFLATIVDEESDYFERSFDALDVPESAWTDPQRRPPTRAFADLIHRAGARGGYAETLAVLVPVEWIYAEWASAAPDSRPEQFYLAEWVDLHDTPAFHDTVSFLRSELDTAAAGASDARRAELARLFDRAVELEVAFFDAAYEYADAEAPTDG